MNYRCRDYPAGLQRGYNALSFGRSHRRHPSAEREGGSRLYEFGKTRTNFGVGYADGTSDLAMSVAAEREIEPWMLYR